MKFCYVDESGTGSEPFAVMVGVLVDAYRMRPTKSDWKSLLQQLSEIVEREVSEFHTRDFYSGNSPWRGLRGEQRAQVISAIFQWFSARRHQIVFSAIDKEKLQGKAQGHSFFEGIGTLWRCLALHITLALQRNNQSLKNNKGHTVLVFDAHEKDQKDFTELVLWPPQWTETYYQRGKKQEPLDQIIDVPHFVDSAHVGLIQVADCFSYFLRRYLEIESGRVPVRYNDEAEVVGEWVEMAMACSIPRAAIYPQRQRCEAAGFFYNIAPKELLS